MPRHLSRPLVTAGLGLLAWAYVFGDYAIGPNILATGTAALILGIASGGNRLAWPFAPLAAMGKTSYEIYLLHPAALYFCGPVLKGLPLIMGWLAYSAAAGSLGWIAHQTLSQPANRWLRARLPAPSTRLN